MKKLTPKQIQHNWELLMGSIRDNITGDRKDKVLAMYEYFKERMILAPASGRDYYHNAYPGGYVEHVLHIMKFAKQVAELWKKGGANINFTDEELIFSAMHHDFGKVGDVNHDYYIPQDSEWHRNNRGEIYKHNPELQYMSVPDRALWLLQHFDIKVTDKEYIGIKLTDGLYDDSNKSYYMSYNPDWSLRSNLPYILHQADMMASKIEYDFWKYGEPETAADTFLEGGKEAPKKKVSTEILKDKRLSENMKQFKELFGDTMGEKTNG